MAFQMTYESPDGDTVETSYWRVVQVSIGQADKTASILFYGYRSKSAREANKQPLSGAIKSYVAGEAEYESYFSDLALKNAEATPVAQAYAFAKSVKDGTAISTSPDDPPSSVSFFESATDV